MAKKSFAIGSMDKAGKNVKTETGWMSVKKYKEANPDWTPGSVAPKAEATTEVKPEKKKEDKKKVSNAAEEYTPRFSSIASAQIALSRKTITQEQFVIEQEALNKKKKVEM